MEPSSTPMKAMKKRSEKGKGTVKDDADEEKTVSKQFVSIMFYCVVLCFHIFLLLFLED